MFDEAFGKTQEFDGYDYEQEEVLTALKKIFEVQTIGDVSLKDIFLGTYHMYHGPDTRSQPCGVVSAEVDKLLTAAKRTEELPYYVMRIYILHCPTRTN